MLGVCVCGGGGGGAGVFDVGVHLLVFVSGLISQALPHVVAKGDAAAIDMILARVDDKDFQYARTTRHGTQAYSNSQSISY